MGRFISLTDPYDAHGGWTDNQKSSSSSADLINNVTPRKKRSRAAFREADVIRALKSAKKAEVEAEVEIKPDGSMIIRPITAKSEHESLSPVQQRRARLGKA